MAAGALTCTEIGLFPISGGYLKTVIDAQTITTCSGQLFLIPIANSNQVAVIKVEEADA